MESKAVEASVRVALTTVATEILGAGFGDFVKKHVTEKNNAFKDFMQRAFASPSWKAAIKGAADTRTHPMGNFTGEAAQVFQRVLQLADNCPSCEQKVMRATIDEAAGAKAGASNNNEDTSKHFPDMLSVAFEEK